MAYKMFLNGLMMPVCPGKVTVKVNSQNKTINLLNGEEINLLRVPGLSDVSFELLLPHRVYPFSAPVVLPISSYLSTFEQLKQRTTGFQWIFVRTKPGGGMQHYTDMAVSLEDYQITDDSAEGLDTTVRMELKQWRAYGTKQAVVTRAEDGSLTAAIAAHRDSSSAPAVSTYVTKAGDTLWNIARQLTGSGDNWQAIAQRGGLSSNTPKPGTRLDLKG